MEFREGVPFIGVSHKLLTADQERDLSLRASAGDQLAISLLVKHNWRFGYHYSKRYAASIPYHERLSAVLEALHYAAIAHDPNRGRFTTFLRMHLSNYLNRALDPHKKERVSIHDPLGDSNEPLENILPTDSEPDPAEAAEVKYALSCLPSEMRRVIELRFFCDLTFSDASQVLNISRSRIQQIEVEALKRMRQVLGGDEE